MRAKLLILLVLIVAVPLGFLVLLSTKLVHNEQIMAQHRLRELVESRLAGVDATIQQTLEAQARLAEREAPEELSTPALRDAGRHASHVRQFFVLNDTGELVYPLLVEAPIEREREFLERSRELWRNPLQVVAQPEAAAEQQSTSSSSTESQGLKQSPVESKVPTPRVGTNGWFTWYWGSGLQFIHWWRSGNFIVGAEMNRTRLVAEIVAALPQTMPDAPAAEGRTILLDSQGVPVYQWGSYVPGTDEEPLVTVPLTAPLASWSLAAYMPADFTNTSVGTGLGLAIGASIAALALAMIGLAVYFYRENSRELREAGQRISFVNQVSHELKTPLTNIRLYAELLEQELDDTTVTPRQHLHTIVAESQRLSRMIANVLTSSRKGRKKIQLQGRSATVDSVVEELITHFREPLQQKGIAIETNLHASDELSIDTDALAQILGNLLGNVEKYARGGDRVSVVTTQSGDTVTITVADNGPGIAERERARIFEPFYRISNRLTDGVAGTGIGLTIARDLARMHGGDIVVNDTEPGATFSVTLRSIPFGGKST